MTIGKIRTYLLDKAARFFFLLSSSPYVLLSKWLYICFRKPFELVTNSYVVHAVTAEDYIKTYGLERKILVSGRKGYYANVVWADINNEQELIETDIPDIGLYKFRDVIVHRGSDLIINLKERMAINDYCATVGDDKNKVYDDSITKAFAGNILIVRLSNKKLDTDSAISLNGKYSFNYYHAIYETLIKLVVIAEHVDKFPESIPFLIDEDTEIIPSLKRIFEILSEGLKHNVLSIPKGYSYLVKDLYWVSSVNFLTPNHKDYLLAKDSEYVFDRENTLKLKEKLLVYKSEQVFPKRIFVSRRGTNHRRFNEDEVFEILERRGFKKVYPQELTIEEQVSLFNGAEWIIGGSGAALTNLLFCSSFCKVVCLSRYTKIMAPVFIPPVCFNQASIVYYRSSKGSSVPIVHSDFSIDINQFKDFAESYIK